MNAKAARQISDERGKARKGRGQNATNRSPARVCFGSKNSFARGPASSNLRPGCAPISIRSGMRTSSLIVWLSVEAKRGSPSVCSSEKDDREHLRRKDAQKGGERIDGGVGDGGGVGAGDVRGEGEGGRVGHAAGKQA